VRVIPPDYMVELVGNRPIYGSVIAQVEREEISRRAAAAVTAECAEAPGNCQTPIAALAERTW
jgi:hypothetical protein